MVEALAARHRLVTIVGTGGCGKTRLALQVARSLSGRNRDQARFIGLGDAGDEREAAAMIARGLGLESDESATDEGLAVALSGGPTLVVLDNCEHVEVSPSDVDTRLTRRLGVGQTSLVRREKEAVPTHVQ